MAPWEASIGFLRLEQDVCDSTTEALSLPGSSAEELVLSWQLLCIVLGWGAEKLFTQRFQLGCCYRINTQVKAITV